MKLWLLIITLSILTACKTAEIPKSAETVQSEKPLTIGDNKTFSSESLPSEIKVRVTISRPEDLRVKVGQKIKTGDVIADRKRERDALLQQKQQAELARERMRKLMWLKDENLEKPVLPDASFAEYEAAINRAQVAVEAAKHSISLQKSRIEQIEKLPFPVDLTKVKQHESARLELLKSELLAAESNLNLERAKLETAKANSNYAEQKDALEIQKSKITAREQRITIESQITQTEAAISNLNIQIIALSAVRAPFAGTIKKINWEGQNNAEINIVITVDVDDNDSDNRAK
jgi:biotin carboxyl carrier protein